MSIIILVLVAVLSTLLSSIDSSYRWIVALSAVFSLLIISQSSRIWNFFFIDRVATTLFGKLFDIESRYHINNKLEELYIAKITPKKWDIEVTINKKTKEISLIRLISLSQKKIP